MNAETHFRFDHARHKAAAQLRPEHIPDFQRLVKTLCHGARFQLLIVEFNDWAYREELIRRLDEVLDAEHVLPTRLDLKAMDYADFAAAEADLVRLAGAYQAVHVVGGEDWFDVARWEAFNIRREAVAQAAPVRLLVWLTAEPIARLAQLAPDLWAWRGGVFAFVVGHSGIPMEPLTPQLELFDNRSLAQRSKRIAALRAFLRAEPPPPDELALPLWDELAGLLASIGELDEALRIRQTEELSIVGKLGDQREKAITWGRIADILQARGRFDEALRIRETEELPVYEKLGDVRERAVTLGDIADILQARGRFDEALRIRETEQLPVFEKLGDAREKAVALGRIADILQARGQFDEALRIRDAEELPVYEKLGDARAKAVALGKIANILQARGQLGEALRLRKTEELPVYRKLGNVRSISISLFEIARIELERKQSDEALGYLAEAYEIAENLQIPDGLAAVGEWYGQLLFQRGEQEKSLSVLETALQAATQLGQEERANHLRELIDQLRAAHDSGS